jgi:hypothetical protein
LLDEKLSVAVAAEAHCLEAVAKRRDYVEGTFAD